MFFQTWWMIVINNRDYNIDQNNRDYDFGHSRAAVQSTHPFSIYRWQFMNTTENLPTKWRCFLKVCKCGQNISVFIKCLFGRKFPHRLWCNPNEVNLIRVQCSLNTGRKCTCRDFLTCFTHLGVRLHDYDQNHNHDYFDQYCNHDY